MLELIFSHILFLRTLISCIFYNYIYIFPYDDVLSSPAKIQFERSGVARYTVVVRTICVVFILFHEIARSYERRMVSRKKSNSICRGNIESSLETSAYRRHLWWEFCASAKIAIISSYHNETSLIFTRLGIFCLRYHANIDIDVTLDSNVGYQFYALF